MSDLFGRGGSRRSSSPPDKRRQACIEIRASCEHPFDGMACRRQHEFEDHLVAEGVGNGTEPLPSFRKQPLKPICDTPFPDMPDAQGPSPGLSPGHLMFCEFVIVIRSPPCALARNRRKLVSP